MGHRGFHPSFGNHMQDYSRRWILRAVLCKGLGSKPLAGGGPFKIAIIDADVLLPTRVENRTANDRTRCGIGVDFGRYIDPALAGTINQAEQQTNRALPL